MNIRKKAPPSKSEKTEEYYYEPRINSMSGNQGFLVTFVGVVLLAGLLVASSYFTRDMYIYDDGESYSCPHDQIEATLAE